MIQDNQTKLFLYPPGGILIWIIVLVEILTFGLALLVFRFDFHNDYHSFISSQNLLSKNIGLFNTIILITGGYTMATTIVNIKQGKKAIAQNWMLLTIITGIIFLVVKGWEYYLKISDGITFGYSDFFDYYWMLTAFHFMHVLVAVVILITLWYKYKNGDYSATDYFDIETGGVFWHMCDLIWILLFPIMYLLH